jgi:hypothetical protein
MNLKYIFLVLISAMCSHMQAQIPVNSPYSRFGIGLTEVGFKSGGMPIVAVCRGWPIPGEYDKPVTYSGGGGSVKVV